MIRVGIRTTVCAMAILFAMSPVSAQNVSPASSGALKSFAESLHARGIAVSEPSLIAALRNLDAEVRSLAALKLAEDHDADAIPSIENALSIETVASARIGIASALWSLQDPKGAVYLQGMCSDSSLSIYVIVDVVRGLSNINESSAPCAGIILSYLDSHRDSETRSSVLWTLSEMYKWVPQNKASQIAGILQAMLSDEAPYVRLQASHALVEIGLRPSAQAIRDAISREKDPMVRASLRRDLSVIEKRP